MAADSAGNDILAVGVPVSGIIGLATFGTTLPTGVEGADPEYTFPVGFRRLGLVKQSGGPQFQWADAGQPIEFWQDGYSIPSGLADVTLTVTAAEILSDLVQEIISGDAPDTNSMVDVDGSAPTTKWVLATEEIFRNGAIRRRVAPWAVLQSSTEEQSNRGTDLGLQLVFKINRSASASGRHFKQWILPAA